MSVIEGIYHNPDTGTDERRLIRCDVEGRLLSAHAAGGAATGMLTWAFHPGRVPRGESATTDPVDLGESHPFTLLVARKLGTASRNEAMEIQSSVDGTRWLPAAGIYPDANVAWYQPDSGNDYFTVQGRPVGRFARIVFQNGNRVQSDLVLELAALAGA
ncbi:hypothetical protein AAIA72_06710 [Hahella sp. SMD15-11]|uniref:Exo-alpha-sialidase n=1 Tax=Thermohahella caldifontis TaxID=3142973 RepID=A0AB39V0H7_9GAMM